MRTVLVSGASGVIGYGVLRSLRKTSAKLRLIGTSIYEDSAAQGFCDVFEKAVPTSSSDYTGWLVSVIKKHKVELVVPGIEDDMYKWHECVTEIEKAGAKAVLNNSKLISLCRDKWLFYQESVGGLSDLLIPSSLSADHAALAAMFGERLLLKPRSGHGSKGIIKVENKGDFDAHRSRIGSELMVQPVIGTDDEEYSASAYGDGKGGFFASMSLKRKLAVAGFTEKAEVVQDVRLEKAMSALCRFYKPIGPTNFQFRVYQGSLRLLEINPRISSATSIRSAFGYNESHMAVEHYLDGKEPGQPYIRKGRAVRYMDDMIFFE